MYDNFFFVRPKMSRMCLFFVVRKGFRAPPAKDMGLMGQEGKRTSHKGLVRPPIWSGLRRRRKGEKGKESVD